MPSDNTHCLTWVSLTSDVGYLFTAAPAKYSHCSLPWTRDITATSPDLESGVAPLSPPVPRMARVNVNILGITKLKWTGMNEFNSDDHYIYYCGQESLRRNGAAIMVNKRI